MKTVLMIVSIVLLVAGLLLFLREQNARDALRTAQAENTTLSNQVFEARVKITEQTVNAVKLETNLTRRVDELLKTSGRLAAASENVGKVEAMFQAAQVRANDLRAQLTAAQSRISQLEKESEQKQAALEKRNAEIDRLTVDAQQTSKEAALIASNLQRAKAELAALRQDFHDPYALREQLDRINRFGTAGPRGPTVSNVQRGAQQLAKRPRAAQGRLVLQDDGSIRLEP